MSRFGRTSFVSAGLGAALAASLFACGGSDDRVGTGCGDFVVPGTIVNRPEVEVSVHNDQGQAIAQGATAILTNRLDSVPPQFPEDSATLAINLGIGTYSIRVTKPQYRDTTINDVVVQAEACGTQSTIQLAVTLHALPSQSRVRSLAIYGAAFLARAGDEARLVPVLDESAGTPATVLWRIDDPSLATIDRTGRVVAMCTTQGGVATVTGIAAADTAVRSSVRFAVAPTDSC